MKTMQSLLCILRQQPKLTKGASSALIDLGEAMHATATREEVDVLIQGTLLQEVYVRNSCLQTIQVHLSSNDLHSLMLIHGTYSLLI